MHRIFKKHYEIFVQRVFNSKDAAENFYNEISKFQRNKDLRDGEILHRFAKKELRYFLRAECPTEKLPEKKGVKSYEIIKSAKRLRYFMNISENFVCTRCSKRETCKFRDILPKSKETSVSDLLIVVNGLFDYRNQVYSEFESQEAEKKNQGEEDHINEEEEEEEHDQDNQKISEDQPQDRYIYKTYDSAIKLIDTLYPIMDDLNFRKGYGSKQYINAYIEENKNLHKNRNEDNFDDSDQEEDFVDKRSFRSESSKKSGKKPYPKKEEISWGSRPKKTFDERGDRFAQNKRNPRVENEAKGFSKSRKFEDNFEEAPQRNRDFSSKKRQSPKSFNNDFDEGDSFVIPKRASTQRNSFKKNDGDEGFSLPRGNYRERGSYQNKQNEGIEHRRNFERPSGGRKIKRNRSEEPRELNIDSFLHNVK